MIVSSSLYGRREVHTLLSVVAKGKSEKIRRTSSTCVVCMYTHRTWPTGQTTKAKLVKVDEAESESPRRSNPFSVSGWRGANHLRLLPQGSRNGGWVPFQPMGHTSPRRAMTYCLFRALSLCAWQSPSI